MNRQHGRFSLSDEVNHLSNVFIAVIRIFARSAKHKVEIRIKFRVDLDVPVSTDVLQIRN